MACRREAAAAGWHTAKRNRHWPAAGDMEIQACPYRASTDKETAAETPDVFPAEGEGKIDKADQIFFAELQGYTGKGRLGYRPGGAPRWEDGTPAHTVKLFGVVNRYDLPGGISHSDHPKINYRAALTSFSGSGRKNPTISMTWPAISGIPGRMKTAPLVRLMAISWESNIYIPKGNSTRWTGCSMTCAITPAAGGFTNIYVHQDLHAMNLYPCAYSMTFNVSGNTLNAILNQRSQDMLTANSWNVVQYAASGDLFAAAAG